MIHGPLSLSMAAPVAADSGSTWPGIGSLLLVGFLGAVLALLLQHLVLSRVARRSARRRQDAGSPEGVRGAWASEVKRNGQGLREFAHEVEERLDLKLDRLEQLVREARSVMDPQGGTDPSSRPVSVPRGVWEAIPREALREGRGDPLGTVSTADRKRVLELAGTGSAPEQIAESLGLPRGEVDLILRLHWSAERVQGA